MFLLVTQRVPVSRSFSSLSQLGSENALWDLEGIGLEKETRSGYCGAYSFFLIHVSHFDTETYWRNTRKVSDGQGDGTQDFPWSVRRGLILRLCSDRDRSFQETRGTHLILLLTTSSVTLLSLPSIKFVFYVVYTFGTQPLFVYGHRSVLFLGGPWWSPSRLHMYQM